MIITKIKKIIKSFFFITFLSLVLTGIEGQALASESSSNSSETAVKSAKASNNQKSNAKSGAKKGSKKSSKAANKVPTNKKTVKNKKKSTASNAKKSSASRLAIKKASSIPSAYVPKIEYSEENPLLVTNSKLIQQRKYFSDAKVAVKKGDAATAFEIKKKYLKNYPLALWIDYWYLVNDMEVGKYREVKKFINKSGHQELSRILKDKYIDFLSEKGEYKKVLELIGKKPFDDESGLSKSQMSKQCRYYEALWKLGKADMTASAFASKIYLQLTPYPSACSGLVRLWDAKGNLNDKTRLDKFERAYITRYYKGTTDDLAVTLAKSIFAKRVALEMSLYQDPSEVMKLDHSGTDENINRAAVLAFKRYANIDPKNATPAFNEFASRFKISEPEKFEIFQIIAKGFLSRQGTLEEVLWVDKNLPALLWSEDIKLMRMRKAIWFAQWNIVYDLYDHLSASDRSQINWRYWKARSARELGFVEEAKTLMTSVAEDRSFFGFLAAQELGLKNAFKHEQLSASAKWPDTVLNNQAAVRFFEFRVLKDGNQSVEWGEIAKHGTNDEALMMAEWALSSGNISYAISSVIAGKRWDALDYRFPKPFLSLYRKYSKNTSVPLSFLYGISRQESMLNPQIKSPVGAVGLMQLMPSTAKMVSKQNRWPYKGAGDLVIPENNIRLGSAYLRAMLDRFDNNRILAAAAYNAGPNRIRAWKSNDGKKRDTAMYVENIPFKETRLYVQNVLLYDTIYKKLLTGVEDKILTKNERSYRY
ncbi:MAG: transglycosylase SLT domain-containing protein [Succinivibrio sp.]